jgi:hypothetical protein
MGKDHVHAITRVSDEPKGLQIPSVRDLANDKGLDEGCDEGPAAASENVQTPGPTGMSALLPRRPGPSIAEILVGRTRELEARIS